MRYLGLDRIQSATGWLIVSVLASTVLLWLLAFGLRIYIHHDALDQVYRDANETVALANHRVTGYRYQVRHAEEVVKAKSLLKTGRMWRAISETWQNSYVCGANSCVRLFVGDINGKMFLAYFIVFAFGLSLIAQGVINLMLTFTRITSIFSSTTSEAAALKELVDEEELEPRKKKTT